MAANQYSHLWKPKKLSEDYSSNTVYKIQRNWSPGVANLPWSEGSDGESESNTSVSFTKPIIKKKVKITKKKVIRKDRKKEHDQYDIENSQMEPVNGNPVMEAISEADPESRLFNLESEVMQVAGVRVGMHDVHDRVALQAIPDLNMTSMSGYHSDGEPHAGEQARLGMSAVKELLAASRRVYQDHTGNNEVAKDRGTEVASDASVVAADNRRAEVTARGIGLTGGNVEVEDGVELDGGQARVEGFEEGGDGVRLVDVGERGNQSVIKVDSRSTKKTTKEERRKRLSTRSSKKNRSDHWVESKRDVDRVKVKPKMADHDVVAQELSESDSVVILIEDDKCRQESSSKQTKLKDQSEVKVNRQRSRSTSRRKSLRSSRDEGAEAKLGMWDYQGLGMEVHRGSKKREKNARLLKPGGTTEVRDGLDSDVVEEEVSNAKRRKSSRTEALQELDSDVVEEEVSNAKRRKSSRTEALQELDSDVVEEEVSNAKRRKSSRTEALQELDSDVVEEEVSNAKRRKSSRTEALQELDSDVVEEEVSNAKRRKSLRTEALQELDSDVVEEEVSNAKRRKSLRTEALQELDSDVVEEEVSNAKKRKSSRLSRIGDVGEVGMWDYRESDLEMKLLKDRKRKKSGSVSNREEGMEMAVTIAEDRTTDKGKTAKIARKKAGKVQKNSSTKAAASGNTTTKATTIRKKSIISTGSQKTTKHGTMIRNKSIVSNIGGTDDSASYEILTIPDSEEQNVKSYETSDSLKITTIPQDVEAKSKDGSKKSERLKVSDKSKMPDTSMAYNKPDVSKTSDASRVSDRSTYHSDATYHDVSTMVSSKQDISLSHIRKALMFADDNDTPSVKFSEESANEHNDQDPSDGVGVDVPVEASGYGGYDSTTQKDGGSKKQRGKKYSTASSKGPTSGRSRGSKHKQRSEDIVTFLWCPRPNSRSKEELNAVDVCLSVYDGIVAQAIQSTRSAKVKSALIKHRRLTQERLMEMV